MWLATLPRCLAVHILLTLLLLLPDGNFVTHGGIWKPDLWIGPPGDHDESWYCSGEEAHTVMLCQNRERILNKLYAMDMMGLGKYNWWTDGSAKKTVAAFNEKIPGFNPDFTNVAFATNTYLYAVRTLRVDTASDVWLCSDEDCQSMQDVGLIKGKSPDGSPMPVLYTAASYLEDTMTALPLVGNPTNFSTKCEEATAQLLAGSTAKPGRGYGLCFAPADSVKGPSKRSFRPVMVPAYTAAIGVEGSTGPFGRLVVGTYTSSTHGCVRLILPRTDWLSQHGWDKQHACANPTSTLVFVTLLPPGLFAATVYNATGKTVLLPNVTVENLMAWSELEWWVYSRVLFCDDAAMSSAFTGARCFVTDMTTDMAQMGDDPNWMAPIVIDDMLLMTFNITDRSKTLSEPGILSSGQRDYRPLRLETNNVSTQAMSRWLYSADMLARNSSIVPWCNRDSAVLTWNKVEVFPVTLDNGSTAATDGAICDYLDRQGRLRLRGGSVPVQPFHTMLQPARVAWADSTNEPVLTGQEQYMGFADSEPVPAGAVLKAMLEALNVVQLSAQMRAERQIATSDMTATAWGAFLNIFAFVVLAFVVFLTAGDLVRNAVEDVFKSRHHRWQVAMVWALPPLAFSATLIPPPLLALLQELNARKNNPAGDTFELGAVQLMAKGYGDYHILVITAYRTTAIFRSYTLGCAVAAMALSVAGVLAATGLSWHAAWKLYKGVKNEAALVQRQEAQELGRGWEEEAAANGAAGHFIKNTSKSV